MMGSTGSPCRVLAITPARGGSKRIPHKNMAMVAGKPLIEWTIDEAHNSRLITKYVISTDDVELIRWVDWNYDDELDTVIRPPELAQDNSPSLAALQHAVLAVENYESGFDIIVHLPCTNPLKAAEDIDAGIELLIEKDADSVIAVHRILDAHPARVKWLEDGRIRDFLPEPQDGQSQLLTPYAYVRSGAFYIVKRDALMGPNGKLFGHENSYAYILPPEKALNIDEMPDLYAAEYLLKKRGEHWQ